MVRMLLFVYIGLQLDHMGENFIRRLYTDSQFRDVNIHYVLFHASFLIDPNFLAKKTCSSLMCDAPIRVKHTHSVHFTRDSDGDVSVCSETLTKSISALHIYL